LRNLTTPGPACGGDRAIAIIDFEDDAGPGRRVDDFAQAVWGFADLTEPGVPLRMAQRDTGNPQ
jgi:hypothetical protein